MKLKFYHYISTQPSLYFQYLLWYSLSQSFHAVQLLCSVADDFVFQHQAEIVNQNKLSNQTHQVRQVATVTLFHMTAVL